ncbi:hypothetical protein CJ193_005030 [Pseudoglutamicibacter albus]|uniref:Uncharacterized protein n=1 Tax=Pseudoglutamicibacter cumminsii TaxID=156979 RepID=A0AAP4FG70_9MICC|nr:MULTISPECIES: hypothetical protein [Pseudoglutamicibacter]MDK6274572.1 hypothetical protein [Pseudoglutamicibacter cumminsii]MDK7083925.1 hypothetical protein [Pseudoglutamicibacter cumminsii]MDZ3744745.1 hypothetical protein [Pseudoglutamicibacter cumminsii]PKY79746.1 hypothetical protein CYJ35_08305 [Pseudoglutamicibacter albus]WIK83471.1 hypothetical protein CJ193_005030 [Pseudoglutamicibacter albus]
MKHGTRLVAGLSAFGLAAAFLTGCGSKDPDQALCDDATAVLEKAGASNTQELDQKLANDPAKLAEVGKGLREAADKNKDSEHAAPVDLAGRMLEVAAKASGDPGQMDPETMQELTKLNQEASSPEIDKSAKELTEKCPAFVSSK